MQKGKIRHPSIIILLVLFTIQVALSCKVHQDGQKHRLFNKATIKRNNSNDTIAVIKQK